MKAKTLHTVYVGKGEKARPILPGEEIDSKAVGLSDVECRALIASGALIAVEAVAAAPAAATPAAPPAATAGDQGGSDPADPASGE